MGKSKKLMSAAAGRIGRQVGDKLNFGTFAKNTAGVLKKQSDEIVKKVRRVSKRRKYLGNTPGKSSRTGREVIERMTKDGKIYARDPKTGKLSQLEPGTETPISEQLLEWKNPETGKTEYVPLSKCDMGHHPVDAVTYWNTTGINHGPKSPEVRDWMLDPANYELQPSSWNRSQGAKLTETYLDPTP